MLLECLMLYSKWSWIEGRVMEVLEVVRSLDDVQCDWTLPIRSWDQYNNGFNPTCLTGYRLQHVRVGSSSSLPGSMVCVEPLGSVLGAILFLLYCGDLQLIIESHGLCPHLGYMLMTHRSMVPVVQRHRRSYNHASQRASIMSPSGCVQIASN